MPDKKFSASVLVNFPGVTTVRTAKQAAQLLMDVRWPKRNLRHQEATETCLKVLEGQRSTIDAETAFRDAANDAGILTE